MAFISLTPRPSAAAVAQRAEQVDRIALWAVAAADALLMRTIDADDWTIQEVHCLEPGCPPMETLVAELSGPPEDVGSRAGVRGGVSSSAPPTSSAIVLKIPLPLIEVGERDVVAAADRLARGVEVECHCGELLLARRAKKPKRFSDGDAMRAAVARAKAKPLVETTREDIGLMMQSAMADLECM